MKKSIIFLFLVLLLSCYTVGVKGGDGELNPKRKVLFFGVDGVRPDSVEVAITDWMNGEESTITEFRKKGALYTTGYVGGEIYENEVAFEAAMRKKLGWEEFDYKEDAIYSYERLVSNSNKFDLTKPIINGLFSPYFTDWQEPNRNSDGSPVVATNEEGKDYIVKEASNPRIMHPTAQTSSSWPGWTTFVTGVWANKNGTGHMLGCPLNDKCQYYHPIPDPNMYKGANFDEYPHFFKRIKEHSENTFLASIMSWTPFNTQIPTHYDYLYHPLRIDGAIPLAVRAILNKKEIPASVLFLGFDRSDWWGHMHGFSPGSKENPNTIPLEYLAQEDIWLGEIMDAIQKRIDKYGEEWLVIISADHGGYDKAEYPEAFWPWDDGKGGDHGTWWTEANLIDDDPTQAGAKTAEEKLAEAKIFADSSRLVPLFMWSNISNATIDTRYGTKTESGWTGGEAAIAETERQVALSYDLTPKTTSQHPITDIMPTILDFIGVPIKEEWNLDGESLLQKEEFNGWIQE